MSTFEALAENEGKPLVHFGEFLRKSRLRAGFRSIDEVIEKAKERQSPHPLSKSMLSLYEQGKVKFLNPYTTWVLAQLYGMPYADIVRRWLQERFMLDPLSETHSQPKGVPMKFLVQSWANDGMPLTLFGFVEADSKEAAAVKLGLTPATVFFLGEPVPGYSHEQLGEVVLFSELREVSSLDHLVLILRTKRRRMRAQLKQRGK